MGADVKRKIASREILAGRLKERQRNGGSHRKERECEKYDNRALLVTLLGGKHQGGLS